VSGSPSESALYTIHRALVRHGRLAEAVKVARKLPQDVNLQQRTWKERLQKAGLDADVQINDERKITVRLRGAVQEKLDLLRGIPATALWMPETDAHDLTPLVGIPLEELDISRTMVAKVDALRDMPLRSLNLDRTQVEDLLPLRGSPVEELHLCHTPVRSIASLRSMPLRKLDISHTKVSDLQPLATVPLRELDASGTVVIDLSPLSHLPLTTVRLDDTRVVDLLPLHGAPITVLSLARTPITSIEALTQTPIAVLSLSGCTQLRDLTPLSRLKDLQKFILPPATNTKEVQAILPQVRFLE
jgi:Leucine-rich repeat (LRR) protein